MFIFTTNNLLIDTNWGVQIFGFRMVLTLFSPQKTYLLKQFQYSLCICSILSLFVSSSLLPQKVSLNKDIFNIYPKCIPSFSIEVHKFGFLIKADPCQGIFNQPAPKGWYF